MAGLLKFKNNNSMAGYEIKHCKSDVQTLNKVPDWKAQFTDAKAIAWFYDAIEFYNIKTGKWNQELRNMEELVRLRIFDEQKEMHIWRSNGELKGRLRTDTIGKETSYVEVNQVMNGTKFINEGNGNIIATEEKGINYVLPFINLENIDSEKKDRIVLVTRNYIDYNDISQAGYVDCRFVKIEIYKK